MCCQTDGDGRAGATRPGMSGAPDRLGAPTDPGSIWV